MAGKLTQKIDLDSNSDNNEDDWNTDIIEATAKNIAQIRNPLGIPKVMSHNVRADYLNENPTVYVSSKTDPSWVFVN